MEAIELDGSNGGGQMPRTALSLSMITGRPFRMINIRGTRSKPGLMRQHLIWEMSDGTADGAEVSWTEVVSVPGK